MADWTLMTLQLRGKTRRFVQRRFAQCRLYPLHAGDLRELEAKCTYTFEAAPGPSLQPAPPAPAFE
jgi:hypothetical protein